MGSIHRYRKIIVELTLNNVIMKKKRLSTNIWWMCIICSLIVIFTGCKKDDDFVISDSDGKYDDITTTKAPDTPVTVIIEGTPETQQTEQPPAGLEIHVRCVEPFDRTCYMLTLKDDDQTPANGYININSPRTDGILPSGTDIPIKNIKFHNKSKSAVSFELVE